MWQIFEPVCINSAAQNVGRDVLYELLICLLLIPARTNMAHAQKLHILRCSKKNSAFLQASSLFTALFHSKAARPFTTKLK